MKNWNPPSPDDVRDLRARFELTQEQLADLACVSTRVVQRYEAPEKTLAHQPPTYHVWELLRVKLGLTSFNPRKILKEFRS